VSVCSKDEAGLEGQHVREQSHRGASGLGAVHLTPSRDQLLAVVLTLSIEHTLCLLKCSCLILVIKLHS